MAFNRVMVYDAFMNKMYFEWDRDKDVSNYEKHGVNFNKAQEAFFDPCRVIAEDIEHSTNVEQRYYCLGKIDNQILTVRFTHRNNKIRIIGAGYWRKGKKNYEQAQKVKYQ